jgi:hypothetical protein
MADYRPHIKAPEGVIPINWESNWIITDTRFPNEIKAVKDRGGITIDVRRHDRTHFEKEHESETALDDYHFFDYFIDNDGTIDELVVKVKEILIKEKIINK